LSNRIHSRVSVRAASAAAASLLVALCAATSAAAAPFFASDSPWNKPLASGAALDADSAGLVGELSRQVTAYGTWINSNQYSVPIYTVPADQPTVPIIVDDRHDMWTNATDAAQLSRTLNPIPIPAAARPAAGTDKHMLIWQPSTDTMWELWQARNPPTPGDLSSFRDNTPGWHASWGAKITGVSTSSGVNPAPWGATASGLALAGGLITNEELKAGRIDHALALAIPDALKTQFVAPATRTDGKYTGAHAIPEGTRFRLPASVDLSKIALPPVTRMIAVAAQKYGIIVRDHAGSVAFYGEDPTPTGNFLLRQLLGVLNPGQALSYFPWAQLQAVAPVQPAPAAGPAPTATSATSTPTPSPSSATTAPTTASALPVMKATASVTAKPRKKARRARARRR
jgi:hypothetical protein